MPRSFTQAKSTRCCASPAKSPPSARPGSPDRTPPPLVSADGRVKPRSPIVTKSRRIFAARSLTFLQFPQAVFEIARIDRPQKGFDHLGKREPLARGDGAAPDCTGDHFYRAQDIACVADRRQSQLDRPFAARRDGPVETDPQCPLIPREPHPA